MLTQIRGNAQILNNSIEEAQLAASILATNSGLTGLGGSKLAVGAGTGISVSGSTVGLATNSTVTFSGATWTFPADELLITGVPSLSNAAVNKAYVDNFVNGLAPRGEVDAVATANVASLSGTTTIDSVPLLASDRVLLTAQTDLTENGIWVIQAGAWTRPADFANGQDASSAYVYTGALGGAYGNSQWICTSTKGSAVIGTNDLDFILFATAGATSYSAGTGISISLGVISLQTPVAVANGGTGVTTFGGTNTLLYTTAANTLASITTANNAILVTDGTGVPSIGTTIPSQVQDNITRTGTLVAGATGAGFTISFTASTVAGTLSVSNGGTGLSTIATNSLVYGNGTSALQLITPAADSVLITSAGSVPSLSTTLPNAVQDNITRTGTLVAGATGSGFTVALGVSTITGILLVGNGGTGVSTLVADQLVVGDGTNAVNTLFKARATVGANSANLTITGLVSGGTLYVVTRNGINETANFANYSASALDTLTNSTDPFVIGETVYVEQIQ